jgi:hypothetical protein
VVAGIESLWRRAGASSGYIDNKLRWSWVRAQTTESGGVVLVGNSQMQFGFSFEAFRDRYPTTPIHQLAIAGSEPYATFRSLAYDDNFTGTVILSFTPEILMPFNHEGQQSHVEHYEERWTIDARLNFLAASVFERFLVTRHHTYGVKWMIQEWFDKGSLPQAILYTETEFNREVHADYQFEDLDGWKSRQIQVKRSLYERLYPVSFESWRNNLEEFLVLAERIIERGGRVIAVRFPSQNKRYDYEEQLFPRETFWHQLESNHLIQTVHFEELGVMTTIDLPDYTHVAKQDKYRFTQALLQAIEAVTCPPEIDQVCIFGSSEEQTNRQGS